jgi:lipopolysaccharide/colanic/teichoic acid biosynthesis glycosyltransferase
VAVLIKLTSPGPVFYRSQRVGRSGRLFTLFKFRTMRADAGGPAITSAADDRITGVGRLLRRSKLDEIPQLYNVIKGDMSLVGPRPEDPRFVALYDVRQRRVLEVRPGITSVASIVYRNEAQLLTGDDWETLYREKIMPDKLLRELDYLERRSFWSDLKVIGATLRAVFVSSGVR